MFAKTESNLMYITNKIEELITQKSSGVLQVSHQSKLLVEIHFYSGRLQYIVDKKHRVRRWQRSIKGSCSNWQAPEIWPENEPWEYELLAQGISKKELTLTQVKGIINEVAKECLFEVCQYDNIEMSWEVLERRRSALAYCLTLSSAEIHPLLSDVEKIKVQCFQMGFNQIDPSLSPVKTENLDSIKPPVSSRYFDGGFTLWDISQQSKMLLTKLIDELKPLIDNKKIILKKLPDLPSAHKKVRQSPRQVSPPKSTPKIGFKSNQGKKKSLIACIDDSAVVGFNLKQILSPMGYDVLTIQEPMTGFGELIKHKPDLILLDLNMPNANGYSVCKFLRETPIFNKIPIIILTSQDTMIDRTRAKLAGATDFIPKPPEAAVLLQMLNNLLLN
ncbi:MAG: response regulator [Crocosphaera sp.]